MHTWIGHDRNDAPSSVVAAARVLGDLREVPGLRTAEGGIHRDNVLERISERVREAGLLEAPHSYLDAVHPRHGLGLRVDAGRAHMNNDGVIAVLAAAADPAVRALILVVPNVYRGGVCADRVIERLHQMLDSPGIDLDLDGVALIAY